MFAGSTIIAPCVFMSAIAASASAIGGRAVAEQPIAHDADARAFQAVGVERRRVVALRPSRRVAVVAASLAIGAGHRAEQRRGVGDGARHRARRVLAVRDRDDAAAADQAERRLDADERVDVRRRHDRAVGLGADRDRREVRGDRRARARARAGRDCDRARTDSSSGRRVRSSRCVECVERKFAHSLRLVLPRITAPASRSRATMNASFGGVAPASASEPAVVIMRSAVAMLSLIRTGMPCSGPRGRAGLALGVERVGDRERVGIELDDAVQRRARCDRSPRCARDICRRAIARCPARTASAAADRRSSLPRDRMWVDG